MNPRYPYGGHPPPSMYDLTEEEMDQQEAEKGFSSYEEIVADFNQWTRNRQAQATPMSPEMEARLIAEDREEALAKQEFHGESKAADASSGDEAL